MVYSGVSSRHMVKKEDKEPGKEVGCDGPISDWVESKREVRDTSESESE